MRLRTFVTAMAMAASFCMPDTAFCYDATSPAATFIISYDDVANYGFKDPTLGAQRKAALEHALSIWAGKLKGTEPIRVSALMLAMGGSGSSAVLASAGPINAAVDPSGTILPHANTVYPVVLTNQYLDDDFEPTANDILVQVNADVDNSTVLGTVDFYYGTDGNPTGGDIDFVTVMLHELGHGLGFMTYMNSSGAMGGGLPDHYMRNLIQQPGGALTAMNDAGRQAAIISNALYWDGASLKNRYNPNTLTSYGNVQMNAPNPYQGGSSVSHFDPSNNPSLLMEPSYTGAAHGLDVTGNVMRDVGWFLDATALPVTVTRFTAE